MNNKNTACYYIVPAMDYVTKDMIAYYRDYTKTVNDQTIWSIMNVLKLGFYKLRNGNDVPISSELQSELRRICSLIHKRTQEFLSHDFDIRYMTLNEFSQFACVYISTSVIDKTHCIFYNMPDSLFVQKKDYELVRLKTMIQAGGGISNYRFDMSVESADFTNIRWFQGDEEGDMLEHYRIQTLVLNIFYDRLKLRYPEKSKDELQYIACDLYAVFRIYIDYIGSTPLQPPFYDECIRMFETGLPTFDEFLKIYAPFQPDLNLSRFSSIESIWAKQEKANANKHTRSYWPVLASGSKRRTRKNK